jgi:hypothetical protein
MYHQPRVDDIGGVSAGRAMDGEWPLGEASGQFRPRSAGMGPELRHSAQAGRTGPELQKLRLRGTGAEYLAVSEYRQVNPLRTTNSH